MPSASWLRDAQSALTSLGWLTARALLALFAAGALVLATTSIGNFRPAGAQPVPKGLITLVSQSPWVESSSVPVRLGLRVRSPVAANDLLVDVALYTEPDQSALASRYEFNTTLTGQLAGLNQLALTTFSLSSISETHASVEIYVTGSELSGQVPTGVPSDQVFQLPCPPRYGGCGGVYPLQVSLVDVFTGQPVTIDSFTTYLIVVPAKVSPPERLRFSFVVPVGVPPAFTPAGAPKVPRGTRTRIETVVRAEASWPQAPLTVDLYGQTLLAVAQSRKNVKLAYAFAAHPDIVVGGPFSAVNPTRLIRAGLGSELASQFARSDQVFAKVLPRIGKLGHLHRNHADRRSRRRRSRRRRHYAHRRPREQPRFGPELQTGGNPVAVHLVGPVSNRGLHRRRSASRPGFGDTSDCAGKSRARGATVAR